MRLKLLYIFMFCIIGMVNLSEASKEDCGTRKVFVPYIFGGSSIQKAEWPWLVAFFHRIESKFFCSGSLVSKKHILSGLQLLNIENVSEIQ